MRLDSLFDVATLLVATGAVAQTPDTTVWTQFSAPGKKGQEDRYGYKDASGRVRIAPTLGGFTNARRFHHIMAVGEARTYQQYYLLKNGRKIGRDSVYVFDFSFDCESEGAIMFRDKKTNRVGFFNAQGHVLIPAIYNHITPFHNGVAVGLIGARRACWGGSNDTLHCEHPRWIGGQQLLINQRNEVLADLATATVNVFHLNWYSLQRNAPAPDTATTVTLTSEGGERYTFTEYDREFRQWFFDVFVPTVRAGDTKKVENLCFSEIAVASRPFGGWPQLSPSIFLKKYPVLLLNKLGRLQRSSTGVDIGPEQLFFTDGAFQPFFTDCGQHFEEKYPVFDVLLRPATGPQQGFGFIRTASGYRLFSVSL